MTSGNSGMEKLIPTVNKLQDICAQMGMTLRFDLPQIAVIGSQSAGKSSVLENFVGRDFLPRGSGIVTRRPLILQLNNGREEYGEFRHCANKKFTNFDEIRLEIEAETKRLTGTNKGISSEPINLKIYSPNVLDLTLVDLPGITKVPVGDQPADIEMQIRKMILSFIQKPNCLILAVSPANCDLANSDALKLAREVDENGDRTIGVITKLDLMDDGTDARDIFEGKLLPLRHGYVGVVNRSQKDIDDKKDITATLKAEQDFIVGHRYYNEISNRLGTPYLQKVLNEKLKMHISETMQSLREKTRKQMISLQKEIQTYKKLYPDEPSDSRALMLTLIKQLQIDFQKEIGSLGCDDVHTDRLARGANIRRIFHECLPDEISQIYYDEDELRREIAFTIENLYGINAILNAPFKAFEVLAKKQIVDLEPPISVCIDKVIVELSDAVQSCTQHISSHPKFRNYIHHEIMTFIAEMSQSNQPNILSLIKMESAYMNTKHSEFKNDKKNSLEDKLQRAVDVYDDLSGEEKKLLVDQSAAYMNQTAEKYKSKKGNVIYQGVSYLKSKDSDYSNRCLCTLNGHHLKLVNFGNSQKPFEIDIPLIGMRFRCEKDDDLTKPTIILFKANDEKLYEDGNEIELSFESFDDFCSLKKRLQRVILEHSTNPLSPQDEDVDIAYKHVTSYMCIVRKTMVDMVPKAITFYIIRELEQFIEIGLLHKLLDREYNNVVDMFGADEEAVENFRRIKIMYETCQEAYKVMMEC